MSLGNHLEELRGCFFRILLVILACAAGVGIFHKEVYDFLQWPMTRAFELANTPEADRNLYSGLMDNFMALLKAVLIAATAISLPFVYREGWRFVKPGLHESEVRAVRPVFISGSFFFILGAALAFYFIVPIGQAFFLSINETTGVTSLIHVSQAIDFTVMLMLIFGLAFETPLLIYALVRAGIVEIQTLQSIRRYVLFGAFVIGAVFTPPDVLTQIVLAGVLVLLYEIGILMARLGARKQD